MTETDQIKKYLAVLKVFNSVVTATRLYPAMSPQVTAAFEQSFTSLQNFIEISGAAHFGVNQGQPVVCGVPLDQQTMELISEVGIFKQLELLGLQNVVFTTVLDRAIFKQIIFVFTARKEKIAREGGGLSFVKALEIETFFPSEFTFDKSSGEGPASSIREKASIEVSGIPHVADDVVFGLIVEKLPDELPGLIKQNSQTESEAVCLVLRGLARGCFKLQIENELGFSPYFERVIQRVGDQLSAERKEEVTERLAHEIVDRGNESAICLLVLQNMSSVFATQVIERIITYIDIALFKKCLGYLKKIEEVVLKEVGKESPLFDQLQKSHYRLLSTEHGTQVAGRESAEQILVEGEKERRRKRLDTGVSAIIQGNMDVINSEEVVFHLPLAVGSMVENGEDDEVEKLLLNLIESPPGENPETKTQRIRCLCLCGEKLVELHRWKWLNRIAVPLLDWLRRVDDGDFIIEKVVMILQVVATKGLESKDTRLASYILDTFMRIRSGNVKRSGPVKALVSRVQDRVVSREVLFNLLNKYLETGDKNTGRMLVLHGPAGAKLLIDALVETEKSDSRMKILELLTALGALLPPVLLKKLDDPMPWYGKRNLIKLLSTTGREEHAEKVVDFFRHADLRVQREAFLCLYKIGGSRKKSLLLKALPLGADPVKQQIIKALSSHPDHEVVSSLLIILQNFNNYSENYREPILIQTCQILNNSNSEEALAGLKAFTGALESHPDKNVYAKVERVAQSAIENLTGRLESNESTTPKDNKAEKAVEKDPRELLSITFSQEEQQIRDSLKKGDAEKAHSMLLDLIVVTAKNRKFDHADKLREWLIELDSMALSDIIRTAEVIEEEKSAAIDKGHLEVWSELYEALTTDEFSTLYHAMQHRKYGGNETIVKQGALLSALFFVNQGKVNLTYMERGSEVLIKSVGRGNILGVDSFFDASVWTVGAVTSSRADVSMLRLDRLNKWKDEYPALESKLNNFCLRFDGVDTYFKTRRKDRRGSERYQVTGRVATVFLDKNGNDSGVGSKGDLADVSEGGVSFFIRISKRDNARILLGRCVRVALPATETVGKTISVEGQILAVRAHHAMENEYSVHIRLKKNIPKMDLRKIVRASRDN